MSLDETGTDQAAVDIQLLTIGHQVHPDGDDLAIVDADVHWISAIDAGDPADPINQELNPNGDRINMGAYGGTTEASLSPGGNGTPPTPLCVNPPQADMNGDCQVNFLDMVIISLEWLTCGYDIQSACGQ